MLLGAGTAILGYGCGVVVATPPVMAGLTLFAGGLVLVFLVLVMLRLTARAFDRLETYYVTGEEVKKADAGGGGSALVPGGARAI
jgi:hypothetical protein